MGDKIFKERKKNNFSKAVALENLNCNFRGIVGKYVFLICKAAVVFVMGTEKILVSTICSLKVHIFFSEFSVLEIISIKMAYKR